MKERKNRSLREQLEEINEPRMARSARIAELNLYISRISEPPSTTVPGTVSKIVEARLSQPEKAQIAVDEVNSSQRDLRIENTLTDEHGNDFSLKKGARVDITVTAKQHG
jgi:hypothetical protein